MKNISPQKSNSLIIDICKFIGAYMVVAIHTTPFEQTDGVISNIYFTLLKCAVPFFFMSTGYLFARRMEWPFHTQESLSLVSHALVKTVKLYVVWSIIYIPFSVIDFYRSNIGFSSAVVTYIKDFFFVGEHYGSVILWYLLASVYAFALIWLLLKIKVNPWIIAAIGFVLLCTRNYIEIAGGSESASMAVKILSKIMGTEFIGQKLFGGLFYISFGMLLGRIKIPVFVDILIMVAGFIGCIALPRFSSFFVITCAVGLFGIAISIKLSYVSEHKILRRLSTGIYFIHLYVYYFVSRLIFHQYHGISAFLIVSLVTTLLAFAYIAICDLIKRKNAVKCKEKA